MKPLASSNVLPLAAAILMVFALAGCGRDSVKVYKVETNDTVMPTTAATAMPAVMPNGLPVPDNSGLPKLKYTLPEGWKEKALTQMRVASFEISADGKQADVSVIPMNGTAGGNLDNVNRWRGQVGLGRIDEVAVQNMNEKVAIAGQDAELFDIVGAGSDRIIASILYRDGTSWFFKITGDAALVEAQKATFITFLKSVTFGAPSAAAAPAMDMSQLPPSHPPIGGMMPATQTRTADVGSHPDWTIPAGWQAAPPSQFLLAEYSIAGANGASAIVNVATGVGGGLLSNVNRWRHMQLGLDEVDQSGLDKLVSTFDVSGAKAQVVDFTGTDAKTGKPARLVGVVLPINGQTWFYKLMGDPEVVAAQKDALVKFVQSAKYP